MFTFGGYDERSKGPHNKFFCLQLATMTWNSLGHTNIPSPRYRHTFVATNDKLIVFGGLYSYARNNMWCKDHFEYNIENQEWKRIRDQNFIGVET
jgi:sugar (pentulose or hexulose) kinase